MQNTQKNEDGYLEFCTNCDAQFEREYVYCPICGAEVESEKNKF